MWPLPHLLWFPPKWKYFVCLWDLQNFIKVGRTTLGQYRDEHALQTTPHVRVSRDPEILWKSQDNTRMSIHSTQPPLVRVSRDTLTIPGQCWDEHTIPYDPPPPPYSIRDPELTLTIPGQYWDEHALHTTASVRVSRAGSIDTLIILGSYSNTTERTVLSQRVVL